jgi:hypothetical protein
MDKEMLKSVRQRTLDRIERYERTFKVIFAAAMVIEATFIWGFIKLADFSNTTHALIFLSMAATYVFLAIGLIALGVQLNRIGRLILKAIELPQPNEETRRKPVLGLE